MLDAFGVSHSQFWNVDYLHAPLKNVLYPLEIPPVWLRHLLDLDSLGSGLAGMVSPASLPLIDVIVPAERQVSKHIAWIEAACCKNCSWC